MPVQKAHWFIRYKLYHIPFWFGYHIMLWTILIGSPLAVMANIGSPYGIKFLFYVIFEALGVYFNLYVLIPRLLEKGRYFSYIVAVLLVTLAVAILIVPGYYLSSSLSGVSMPELYGVNGDNFWHFFQANTFASTVASMTLAMSVKLTKNWIESRQRQGQLENEKLETELKFLKSQLNPHFLFNTINSIFVLIPQDPKLASSTLAKFSDLLRYQLYDCNDARIPLDQEVLFIRNFVELELLRQEPDLKFSFDWPQHTGEWGIAPFVLLPFIENAFKHVSHSRKRAGFISIRMSLADDKLILVVNNSSDPQQQAVHVVAYGGIGLNNVQRRLDLVYPGKHELLIEQTSDTHHIRLTLELTSIVPVPKIISV
ncbi:MAG: histidine kinase [Chitinophagaceae bacterium]